MTHWLFKVSKIVGVGLLSGPGGALAQALNEWSEAEFDERLRNLEDPISGLHPDIPNVSKEIYSMLSEQDDYFLSLTPEFHTSYDKALAILNSEQLIRLRIFANTSASDKIELVNPIYIMYMASHFEDENKVDELIDILERCQKGEVLNGSELKTSLGIPVRLIRAVFEVYCRKGYGSLSGRVGAHIYTSTVNAID